MAPAHPDPIAGMILHPLPMARDTNSLEQELRLREFEIELLKETANAVTSQLQLDNVLQLIAERARTLIQAETLLIPILNEDCSEYTYKAGCGKNADEIIGTTLPRDYGICGWVWENRRPWWRGMQSELDQEDQARWEHEAGAVILVPLIGKNHFLGGIAGLRKLDGGEFTRRDMDLLTMFAAQVGIAVENAITYEALAAAKAAAENYRDQLEHLNSQLARTNIELEHLALYDSLTGLPNRSLIQDRIQQALYAATRDGHQLGIFVLDLDQFKDINDTLGHETGDQLLKAVGERYSAVLRKTDTVGRLGGDEFAVIIPDTDMDAAVRLAEQLLAALQQPFQLGNNTLTIDASLGIALYPEHGLDVATLLKHADVAMYVAKRNKSGYAQYDTTDDPHNPSRLALLGDLRQALARKELLLYYQPKIDLRTGRIIGAEALARWEHRELGMIMPDDFIPVMEQTGLIRGFTQLALDMALEQCARWQQLGYPLTMAINLSTHNLRDPQLAAQIASLLEKWSLSRDSIILEITESAVMSESTIAQETLEAIDRSGVHFSIDDFGTGHSSLSRLKRLPVQELKIDRTFIKDMLLDSDDAVIVHSTIDLAHNLGLTVTAEGVEDAATAQRLLELGCDYAQGYYFSRPVTADEMTEMLEAAQ
jgi:diguanylate cyclase